MNLTLRSVVPLAMLLMLPKCEFDIRTLTSEFPRHQLERGILSQIFPSVLFLPNNLDSES